MTGLNADGLIYSQNYEKTLNETVMPYIEARRTNLKVEGEGRRPLYVSRFDADTSMGTVLIVHGFTENAEKYVELIHSMLNNSLSVVAYDQRGHGRSWRAEGLSDLSLTHVDAFEEYVEDMDAVYRKVMAQMPRPHRIFCHSMGGAVTSLYLEGHPGLFDRAAMCTPMIAPNLKGLPSVAVRLMCRANQAMGRGRKRVFVFKPYSYPDDFDTSCTTGRERFEWYEALRRNHPEFSNNSPSYKWLLESVGVTDKILAPGAVERIDAKIRLYTAAIDNMVLPEPQKEFTARLRDATRVDVEGAKHEIFSSSDDVLFPWWQDVLAFLKG